MLSKNLGNSYMSGSMENFLLPYYKLTLFEFIPKREFDFQLI